MTCCFIGHRKIDITEALTFQLQQLLLKLLTAGVTTFLFGDHSAFNTLCYDTVTQLKNMYPQIKRVHIRTNYQKANSYTIQFLCAGYEDSIYPFHSPVLGKAAYIARNRAMVQQSDFCIFYYNSTYCPAQCNEAICNSERNQSKSGTALAFSYAKSQHKTIFNLYSATQTG